MAAKFKQITLTPDGKGSFAGIAQLDVTEPEWGLQGNRFIDLTAQEVIDILTTPDSVGAVLGGKIGKTVDNPAVADAAVLP